MKKCAKCGNIYPATTEYFPRCRSNKDGLYSYCKECKNIDARNHYKINKEKVLIRQRLYYQIHKEEIANKSEKHWRQEGVKEHRREYQRQEKVRNRRREYRHKYHKEHPEKRKEYQRKYYIEHKKEINEAGKRWRTENPEKNRAKGINGRARRALAEGSHTTNDLIEIMWHQNGKCLYCGDFLLDKPREENHLDHFIPLKLGGSNYKSNLVWACEHCNLSKRDTLPQEWLGWNGAYPIFWNSIQEKTE